MAQPIAGWYPDPSGDASKLRYWDGDQWTSNFMDNPNAPVGEPVTQVQAGAQIAAPAGTQVGTQANAQPAYTQNVQNQYQIYTQQYAGQVYPMTKEDQTLRLIAFIFCIISTVSMAVFILPLAWCIPMTVRAWGIYKGTKPNTTVFGVCSLIFLSLVAGILLLISNKDD